MWAIPNIVGVGQLLGKLIITSSTAILTSGLVVAQEGYYPHGVTPNPGTASYGIVIDAPNWRFDVFGDYDALNQRRDDVLATYAETGGTVIFADRQPVPVSLLITYPCTTGMAGIGGKFVASITASAPLGSTVIKDDRVLLANWHTILRGKVTDYAITIATLSQSRSWSWDILLDVPDLRHAEGDLVLEVPVAAQESPEELHGFQLVRFNTTGLNHVFELLERACEVKEY